MAAPAVPSTQRYQELQYDAQQQDEEDDDDDDDVYAAVLPTKSSDTKKAAMDARAKRGGAQEKEPVVCIDDEIQVLSIDKDKKQPKHSPPDTTDSSSFKNDEVGFILHHIYYCWKLWNMAASFLHWNVS